MLKFVDFKPDELRAWLGNGEVEGESVRVRWSWWEFRHRTAESFVNWPIFLLTLLGTVMNAAASVTCLCALLSADDATHSEVWWQGGVSKMEEGDKADSTDIGR